MYNEYSSRSIYDSHDVDAKYAAESVFELVIQRVTSPQNKIQKQAVRSYARGSSFLPEKFVSQH